MDGTAGRLPARPRGPIEGSTSAIVEPWFQSVRNPASEAPGHAPGGDSWHAPCTSNAAVRNRSHLNLSETFEMNARASTPAQTGKALKQPTLGSVWGNDAGQDLAEYAILIGLIALVVYHKLGLRMLRTLWFNIDLVWGAALVLTGAFTLAL